MKKSKKIIDAEEKYLVFASWYEGDAWSILAELGFFELGMANNGVATCVGCGCDDLHACPGGCSWLRLDRTAGVGVCSECEDMVEDWDNGERDIQCNSKNPQACPNYIHPSCYENTRDGCLIDGRCKYGNHPPIL
ncbi:MAG: hypothetical protein ACYCSQ_00420 [bacterium]